MDPQLTAIIVHDLKNALGVLEGQLSALTITLDSEQAIQAHANCVSLREKTIAFLTLYKASEQGLQPHMEAVNPEDFLNALLRNHPVSRPELTISIHPGEMPSIAFFDEHLVGLALDAALQNAIRFAKSEIILACSKIDDEIVFTIRDNGPGLHSVETKPSTGIGMALCEAIAHAHHNDTRRGSAQLETRASGGARFTLCLP